MAACALSVPCCSGYGKRAEWRSHEAQLPFKAGRLMEGESEGKPVGIEVGAVWVATGEGDVFRSFAGSVPKATFMHRRGFLCNPTSKKTCLPKRTFMHRRGV